MKAVSFFLSCRVRKGISKYLSGPSFDSRQCINGALKGHDYSGVRVVYYLNVEPILGRVMDWHASEKFYDLLRLK